MFLKKGEKFGRIVKWLELTFNNRQCAVQWIGMHDHLVDFFVQLVEARPFVHDVFNQHRTGAFFDIVVSSLLGEALLLLVLMIMLHCLDELATLVGFFFTCFCFSLARKFTRD